MEIPMSEKRSSQMFAMQMVHGRKLTEQGSREGSEQDSITYNTQVCHVDQSLARCLGIEVGLIDIVGED